METTVSLRYFGLAVAQVHQADQAWLPSLMHSFVGYGSIREPYPLLMFETSCDLRLHPSEQELHTHITGRAGR